MEKDNRYRIEQDLMEAYTYEKTDAEIGMPNVDAELLLVRSIAKKHEKHKILRRIAAAAACAILITGIGLATQHEENSCVAYVGGQRITDESKVMELLEEDLGKINSCNEILEDQLNEFFSE